jgi:hypothetical protein
VLTNRTAERLRAYAAIRADAEALAVELRRYRVGQWGAGTPPAERIDLSVISQFQRRLASIRARWETIASG